MTIEQLRHALLTDEMTGLGSKRAYLEELGLWDTGSEQAKRRVDQTIASVDADSMKYINDKYGHPVGDDYLRMIGRAIRDGIAKTGKGKGFHLSGDEFAIIFDNTMDAGQRSRLYKR